MNKETVLEFTYNNLDTEEGMVEYSELADTYNLRKGTHSKTKNYVINSLYSIDISSQERELYLLLYDLLAQQKYLPSIQLNNTQISQILWKDKSTISKSINRLIEKNLLSKTQNIHGYDCYVVNENINTWWLAIDKKRLDLMELKRKHLAWLNTHHSEGYKDYKSNQQVVALSQH